MITPSYVVRTSAPKCPNASYFAKNKNDNIKAITCVTKKLISFHSFALPFATVSRTRFSGLFKTERKKKSLGKV